jgi:hypothetical protein
MLADDRRLHVRRYDDSCAVLEDPDAGVPLHLLITDVQMPRMDGRVLAGALCRLVPPHGHRGLIPGSAWPGSNSASHHSLLSTEHTSGSSAAVL